MTNTVTYHSTNALPGQEWLAYVVMPNGKLWMVASFGATEEAARAKIIALWESERVKVSKPADPWLTVDFNSNHHLAGLVWVIHKVSREKQRVSVEMANDRIATGHWERGGPRSK